MKLILHHFLKDIREQRWLLLIWALYLVVQSIISLLATQPNYNLAQYNEKLNELPFLALIGWVTAAIIMVRLVQNEPALGSTSFWLTRPIPKATALPSKLIFIVTLILLPSFIPIWVDISGYLLDSNQSHELLLVRLTLVGCSTIGILWLATYTRTLAQFGGVILLLFLLIVLYQALLALQLTHPATQSRPDPLATALDNTRTSLCFDILYPGLVLSIIVQHLRRTRLGLYIGIAAIALAYGVSSFWPVPFSRPIASASKPSPPPPQIAFNLNVDKHLRWAPPDVYHNNVQAYGVISPDDTLGATAPIIDSIKATFTAPDQPPILLDENRGAITSTGQTNWGNRIAATLPGWNLTFKDGIYSNPKYVTLQTINIFNVIPTLIPQLKGQTGTLTLDLRGQLKSPHKLMEIPLDSPRMLRQPGTILRVFTDPDSPHILNLATVSYTKEWNPMTMTGMPNRYFALLDPATHTGYVQMSNGAQTQAFGGSLSKVSRLEKIELPDSYNLDHKILVIYEIKSDGKFTSQVTAPNFIMDYDNHSRAR